MYSKMEKDLGAVHKIVEGVFSFSPYLVVQWIEGSHELREVWVKKQLGLKVTHAC